MALLTVLLWACGGVLGVCAAYDIAFMAASLPSLLRRGGPIVRFLPRTRFLVVIPAHDESALIAGTVRSVLATDYPAALRTVVVIADNCTDDTAAKARRAGATCLERVDADRRGKPWALNWLFNTIDLSAYGGVAIVDADTIVDSRFLRVMDGRLQRGEPPIQRYSATLNTNGACRLWRSTGARLSAKACGKETSCPSMRCSTSRVRRTRCSWSGPCVTWLSR